MVQRYRRGFTSAERTEMWDRWQAGFREVSKELTKDNALYEAHHCLSCGNCYECDNCYGIFSAKCAYGAICIDPETV